jgi:hypothetical protein
MARTLAALPSKIMRTMLFRCIRALIHGYVTYLGETLVTDGVAISLIASGDVDTVRVAPASP